MWAMTIEIIFMLCLAYVPGLWTVMGTRDVSFLHFGIPAVTFSLFMLIYDEGRKYLITDGIAQGKNGQKPGWWARNYAY